MPRAEENAPMVLVRCCGVIAYCGTDRTWAEEIAADRQDHGHDARLFVEVDARG